MPENTLRQRAAVGGTTVAFEDIYAMSTSSAPEISVADTSNPSAPAVRLTNDGWADRYPAVSPDGKVVVWVKSTGTGSDVYEAMKNPDGTWSNPQLLTGTEGNESFPDTDGKIIGWFGSATDIDDRKRAEEELAKSNAILQATIENLPFDFFAIGQDGRYQLAKFFCSSATVRPVG